MSNLTVALAILGGLVLAAVIGYNAWMSRRNAPKQPEAASQPAPLEGAPQSNFGTEPVLHLDPHHTPGSERHEPLFDPDLPPPSGLAGSSADKRGGLDPLIDVIAPVSLDGLASGDAAL